MKKCILALLSVIVFVAAFFALQNLLVPKYVENNREGALIREYYENAGDNDIIFLGDCEVYANFSPVILWEEYGVTSYIRGSANQTIWQSYYLLLETLEYETPKAVVFNVLSMKYDEPVKEEYNRLTLEGMKFSKIKLKSINASMTSKENVLDYIFPILRYHDRYDELGIEDFKYFFNKPQVSYKGYLMEKGVVPYTALPGSPELTNYEFSDVCYEYLEKMAMLCEKKGVELILIKAPTLYPYWYEQWDENMEKFAKEKGLRYFNFLEDTEEIGLDFSADTYDGGLHLNVYGAEKLTRYFGKILLEDLKFEKVSHSSDVTKEWNELLQEYKKERDAQ